MKIYHCTKIIRRNETPEVNKSRDSLISLSLLVFTKVARGLINESRTALWTQKTALSNIGFALDGRMKVEQKSSSTRYAGCQLTGSTNNWLTKLAVISQGTLYVIYFNMKYVINRYPRINFQLICNPIELISKWITIEDLWKWLQFRSMFLKYDLPRRVSSWQKCRNYLLCP